jgi:alginate O-acetyltransferase complex protein AlgI
MLFHSEEFLFLFLPLVLGLFFLIGRINQFSAASFLFLASLSFYSWWNPKYTLLLLFSISINFFIGRAILKTRQTAGETKSKLILVLGIIFNLALLGYYKYANFLIENINATLGANLHLSQIILPLGISFFTFTQIAFLVDAHKNKAEEYDFVHYGIFVTFFPHLLAGPIYHHREIMPQFAKPSTYKFSSENLAIGLTIFFIGMFKKVGLADQFALLADPVFNAAAKGESLHFLKSWTGATAYSLQLYFDFSGYMDMAIGLSRTIGVKLPVNFDSPYKSVNIIEFWRRWHITLGRFLRDYLYIPLGGNQKGAKRQAINVLVTFFLGGLWHGAGWTYIAWGTLHGCYLVVCRLWLQLREKMGCSVEGKWHQNLLGCLLTFTSVTVAWVLFRAESLQAAKVIFIGMSGGSGVIIPNSLLDDIVSARDSLTSIGISFGHEPFGKALYLILLGLCIAWFFPNSQQIMAKYDPVIPHTSGSTIEKSGNSKFQPWRFQWDMNKKWAFVSGLIGLIALSITLASETPSQFLYYIF